MFLDQKGHPARQRHARDVDGQLQRTADHFRPGAERQTGATLPAAGMVVTEMNTSASPPARRGPGQNPAAPAISDTSSDHLCPGCR